LAHDTASGAHIQNVSVPAPLLVLGPGFPGQSLSEAGMTRNLPLFPGEMKFELSTNSPPRTSAVVPAVEFTQGIVTAAQLALPAD
jgi:hypothetical protein